MKTILLAIGILFSVATVLGCSPVYQVRYRYLAPESAESKDCIQKCDRRKTQCDQEVGQRSEQERLDLEKAYQQCLLSQQNTRAPILCSDQSKFIQPDYSGCLRGYNGCFQGCGGKVEEEKVCTSHCG